MSTTITRSIEKLVWLVIPLLAVAAVGVRADAHEAPPPPAALEAFFCNYNPGKDRGDLDAAITFYEKQAAKAGFAQPDAVLWTHQKGNAPADIVWLNIHANLVALGASYDAELASAEMVAANARFDSVASCQPNIGTVRAVIPPPDLTTPAGSIVASYACNLTDGSNTTDLADLANHIKGVNAGLGDVGLDAAFEITPLTAGPDGPDVVLLARAASMEAWAANLAALNSSAEGQTLIRHFNAVVKCSLNLYTVEQVVGGDG